MNDPIFVRSRSGDYPVHVWPGAMDSVGGLAAERLAGRRIALIADDTVAELYAAEVLEALRSSGMTSSHFTFPAGEASKNRKLWSELTDRMLADGFGRDSAVVALGGGVTGDLAGFVAASYMRGLPVVQVPTSVVAMVDSAVGGKTGVDTPSGKNLVGAFHPPVAVVADPTVLKTLSTAQRSDGWVEAVKHGAIVDEAYLESLEVDGDRLVEGEPDAASRAVRRSVEIKAAVVSEDERESGKRMILNFGHTYGHALEAASAYCLGHGSAVAAGMVMEAELGEALGITRSGTADRLTEALEAIGVVPELSAEIGWPRVEDYILHDKKARGGEPRFVLLEKVGCVEAGAGWSRPVNPDLVRRIFETSRLRDGHGIARK